MQVALSFLMYSDLEAISRLLSSLGGLGHILKSFPHLFFIHSHVDWVSLTLTLWYDERIKWEQAR